MDSLKYLLDISQSHSSIKYANAPALAASTGCDLLPAPESQGLRGWVVIILMECQGTGALVLYKNIASSISSPVSQMDANAWPWNAEGQLDAVPPDGRLVDIDVDFIRVSVHVDPYIII